MKIRPELHKYETLVFDCDGVILDSNRVKTDAFYHATLSFGERAASEMVRYHVSNGGVSRYQKFAFFLDNIAPRGSFSGDPRIVHEELLKRYADRVHAGLRHCRIAPGLKQLREFTSGARWLIVSGGDQAELRTLFKERAIDNWFDGGIFGSPQTKEQILDRESQSGNIVTPALFIGDSVYDYKAARGAGLDFVFVTDWTEVVNWKVWVEREGIVSVPMISNLMNG